MLVCDELDYSCALPNGGKRILNRMAVCVLKYYSNYGACSRKDLMRSGFTPKQIDDFKCLAEKAWQNNFKDSD